MTLGFKQHFIWRGADGKPEPTYFREKILACAGVIKIDGKNINPHGPIVNDGYKPKLHTMRIDPHNRWKPGRKIEMVYRGAGYKILDHFNKDIPELERCASIQKVEIKYGSTFGAFQAVIVAVDGRILSEQERLTLAINDGFSSLEQFYKWFKTDWSGKIIHWTDLRY